MTNEVPTMLETDLLKDGVLWAINRVLFHPRGYALAYDQADGTFFILGDGRETWRFATKEEGLDAPGEGEDDKFLAFEDVLSRAQAHAYHKAREAQGSV